METMDYIWHNGKLVDWHEAKIHVLTHGLHYGTGAFEGIRVYQTNRGSAVFRLQDHLKRLFRSSAAINIKLPYELDELLHATLDLLRKNNLKEGYIRPIVFHGSGKMGVNPNGAGVEVVISCWPWGKYLAHDLVDVQTSKYIRIPSNATASGHKISGNYVNGALASLELHGSDYHEALLLDSDGFIAEGVAENVFFIKDQLISTPTGKSILSGITRNTIMKLAEDSGYRVIERDITLDEAYQSDEAFFTGTAAEVVPIRSLDDKILGNGQTGVVTEQLKNGYAKIVRGEDPLYCDYLTFV